MLRLYTLFDLNGTFLGIWLAHTAFGLPMAVYLLYTYISQLPRELMELAFIDGASHFTAFTKLVLPLSCKYSVNSPTTLLCPRYLSWFSERIDSFGTLIGSQSGDWEPDELAIVSAIRAVRQ
ncbi:ABC transporter permease subunit [Anaerolineales bacterium HSG25]|nr:ABC transporter permease subunit [Anaerolineales bacterium HSG25]